MWMQRNLESLADVGRIIVVEAQDEYGFPYLINELRNEKPHVLWMSLEPDDAGDKISQGDKLASASSRAFSSPLFGTGLPYSFGLSVLRKHLDVLAPLTLVLSNAEYGVPFASALLALASPVSSVILQFQRIPIHFEHPSKAELITAKRLGLSHLEADELVRGRLPKAAASRILVESRGAYESFVSLLHSRLGLPPIERPSPFGSVKLTDLPEVDVEGLLDTLIDSGLWIDAFELGARHVPERAPDVIEMAGETYFSEGRFSQFWHNLKLLPQSLMDDERVAYWRYAAALATNNHRQLQAEVGGYLESHSAPELRALVAISLPRQDMLEETERAHRTRQNAVTTRAIGFAYSVSGDPFTGIDYLHSANRFARDEDNKQLMVASSNELALAYQLAGKYRDAHRWALRALSQFTEFGMNEELRRLFIVSDVAFPALLIDEVESVGTLLDSILVPQELYGIPSMEGVISTLAEYCLLKGDTQRALSYAEINLKNLPAQLRGYATLGMVRALLEAGDEIRATELADATFCDSYHASEVEQLRASLALGLAITKARPEEAGTYLKAAQEGFQRVLSAPYLAQATISLARVHLTQGRVEEARRTFAQGEAGLRELAKSGWILLGGPEESIHEVWELWNEDSTPVELRFLGGRKLRLGHRTVDYPLRWCEILAVLAFHPDGLNGEKLSLLLYGDGGNMSTLKANLSRMRKDVPVSSRPYQIEQPYKADYVELDRALREGRVREALELYHGPLLPESEAPFVVELRDYLEETLRQAALNSGDVQVLLSLARKLRDDLELWEAASQRLSQNDPLLPLAKAHVKRIQRSWGG